MHNKILILDFGSQVTQLIARRVREAHVYCEIHPADVSDDFVRGFGAQGVILSGSHMSAYEEETDRAPQAVFDLGVPVLGICYGMQTMAQQLGGKVEAGTVREFGYAEVRARGHTKLLDGIEDFRTEQGHGMLKVWMSHGDKVTELPPGFKLMASTDSCPIAGMADEARRFYGVQFHPEVTHTARGADILRKFVLDVCGCAADWIMGDYIEEAVARIREQVGDEEVILGLSGGVDSSVAAALIHRAIGDQLTCVFVDHGLLRLNEGQHGDGHVRRPAARAGDPRRCVRPVPRSPEGRQRPGSQAQDHRPRIRRGVQGRGGEAESGRAGPQGCVLPRPGHHLPGRDRVGRRQEQEGDNIKSHHNVGGLPEKLGLKLLEPLRELFKDEVRELGVALGLPRDMVYRHPFPGPGLGVRILGEIHREYADLLRRADAIFIEELRNTIDPASGKSWYDLTSQAFAVFLPVKSVGVMGDGRTYEWVVALRAVQTQDFMTAHWAELPHSLLGRACQPHHQRGARHQPGGVRHLRQAAGDDRVGMIRRLSRSIEGSIEK
jgi:GMP synthase (glutamine-hydrolysing)